MNEEFKEKGKDKQFIYSTNEDLFTYIRDKISNMR